MSGDTWKVTYMNAETKENVTDTCSFVVIATGQYNTPNIPHFMGQEAYRGKLLHSHDYKDAEQYRNRSVLLIGGGPSALDLAIQHTNVTSKLVHSHHLIYNEPDFGGAYIKKPDLSHFNPKGAVFVDGSSEEFDVAILCTGYNFLHPFLSHNSSGLTLTSKYIIPLYQHIVNINHPTMTFVGISKLVMTALLDAQAEYSAALAAGRFQLPSQETMLQHWLDNYESIKEKNLTINDVNLIGIENMDGYLHALHEEAGIRKIPPVLTSLSILNVNNFFGDLLNYRNNDYEIVNDTQFIKTYNPNKKYCLIDI